ncbi:unnamed protein product [Moneuplotes crassus]|uniref:Uncharacterized protein n=1 Tax=Euplotes crassus TaxID=5936 RepID=A0AAD1XV58_EUPCR|nr:unnamed protein product [Moneuplotes crassus]
MEKDNFLGLKLLFHAKSLLSLGTTMIDSPRVIIVLMSLPMLTLLQFFCPFRSQRFDYVCIFLDKCRQFSCTLLIFVQPESGPIEKVCSVEHPKYPFGMGGSFSCVDKKASE